MSALERPGTPRLHNEYGQPLTKDAIAAELERCGIKTVESRHLAKLVDEQVDERISAEADARKDKYIKRLWRNFYIAVRGLGVLVAIQIAMAILSVWCGDWRFGETAAWLILADVAGGVAAGILFAEIPDDREERYLKVFP